MQYTLVEDRKYKGQYALYIEHKGVSLWSNAINTIEKWETILGVSKEEFEIKKA